MWRQKTPPSKSLQANKKNTKPVKHHSIIRNPSFIPHMWRQTKWTNSDKHTHAKSSPDTHTSYIPDANSITAAPLVYWYPRPWTRVQASQMAWHSTTGECDYIKLLADFKCRKCHCTDGPINYCTRARGRTRDPRKSLQSRNCTWLTLHALKQNPALFIRTHTHGHTPHVRARVCAF